MNNEPVWSLMNLYSSFRNTLDIYTFLKKRRRFPHSIQNTRVISGVRLCMTDKHTICERMKSELNDVPDKIYGKCRDVSCGSPVQLCYLVFQSRNAVGGNC
jgi:hypothetical protein